MLKKAGIKRIVPADSFSINYSNFPRPNRARLFLIANDGHFYEFRLPAEIMDTISLDWQAFISMGERSREIIGDTLSEISRPAFFLHYVKEPFDEMFPQHSSEPIQESFSSLAISQDTND